MSVEVVTPATETDEVIGEVPKNIDIPKELEAQVQSIRAFAQTHNVLATGTYARGYFEAVSDCIQFVKSLHARAIEVALEHPQAELVPELKLLKGQLSAAGEVQNG